MYSFKCRGHKNITSSHKNTLEFTKDKDITPTGNCIVGVDADFDLKKLKQEIKDKTNIKITIHVNNLKEEINCKVNTDFDDSREIVIRRSDFNSKRTLGVGCNKTSSDLKKELKDILRYPKQIIKVMIK